MTVTYGMKRLVRAMGIEPTSQAWEARVLPLNDARIIRGTCLPGEAGDVKAAEQRVSIFLNFMRTSKKTCLHPDA